VSQCGHCRFLRKSRSIHKQCHYLDRTHFEGKRDTANTMSCWSSSLTLSAVDICCCIYSGQFSCIIEKPHIPPIREFLHNIAYNEPPLLGIDADRLRLGTVKSDGRYLVEQQAKRDQEQKELSSREGIFSQVARTSNDMALHEF
jgi:hypothetical protein